MIVVSNTSPIIGLAAIRCLDLLRDLFGKIHIPEAVYRELDFFDQPGAREARDLGWIVVLALREPALAQALDLELDEGEAAAIALALELGADVVLIDERRGRSVAGRLGLNVLGVLGVLLEAKSQDRIPHIRPVLDALIRDTGFRIGDKLRERVLREAGEMDSAT